MKKNKISTGEVVFAIIVLMILTAVVVSHHQTKIIKVVEPTVIYSQ